MINFCCFFFIRNDNLYFKHLRWVLKPNKNYNANPQYIFIHVKPLLQWSVRELYKKKIAYVPHVVNKLFEAVATARRTFQCWWFWHTSIDGITVASFSLVVFIQLSSKDNLFIEETNSSSQESFLLVLWCWSPLFTDVLREKLKEALSEGLLERTIANMRLHSSSTI